MIISKNIQKESCNIDGCTRPGKLFRGGNRYYVLGLCGMHYQRLSKDEISVLKNSLGKNINNKRAPKIDSRKTKQTKVFRVPLTINGSFYIPVGKDSDNKYAIIDIEDKYITKYNWNLNITNYAYARINGENKFMHRLLLPVSEGLVVDHINRNTLDNRKSNLRAATTSQNLFNKKLYKSNTSGYKGVYLDNGKWKAVVRVNGRKVSGGTFSSKEEAARKYNEMAIKHHGAFASLNDIN